MNLEQKAIGSTPNSVDRRALLLGSGAAALGLCAYRWGSRYFAPPAPVFVARGQRYDGPLEQTIRDGLIAAGLNTRRLKGKRVLLKPNLVEPGRDHPHVTTHPAMIVAAAEVFRRFGASVVVGEGPGHVRDTDLILSESGVHDALLGTRIEYVDLNYDDSRPTKNLGRTSALKEFHFPRAVLEADLVVSMPKLKSHHWVGMTAAMKNMYGILPGLIYGWPKNVLHHAGIPETVYDINASLPNMIAIVDAITCMEGDGPIMGTAKPLGMIAISTSAAAADATCARIMGLAPERISYLQLAERRSAPIAERSIEQRGERWQDLASPFEILDRPHLRQLRMATVSMPRG